MLKQQMPKFEAMIRVKAGRPIVSPTLRLVALLGRAVNFSCVRVVITFFRDLSLIAKKGGTRFAVIYLKACHVMLMQAIGGQVSKDLGPLGARPSRSRGSGLPRLIPALHRARIRRGDVWVIRLWTTLLSLYRVLPLEGILKLSTITDPCHTDGEFIASFSHWLIKLFLPSLKEREVRLADALWEGPTTLMRSLRAVPFLIMKSTPVLLRDGRQDPDHPGFVSTSPLGIIMAAHLWKTSPLYPALLAWCEMTGNTWVPNRIDSWSKGFRSVGTAPVHFDGGSLGRLGLKLESAGKVRVFAIVDCFTQWLMKPLHDAIFELLKTFPQDGTFDQEAPLKRLMERLPKGTPFYSFDLSAATDRLPIAIQKVILSPFLTSWGAEVWAQLMTARPFTVPFVPKGIKVPPSGPQPFDCVYYETGQPMGALSSWGMLALTHHALVQFAAYRAKLLDYDTCSWFEDYAVLGDDVVIANDKVADQYVVIMKTLGVGIGFHKSLISKRGLALEFAKKLYLKGHNVSAIPYLEFFTSLININAMVELARKYRLTLGQYLTALGYGYRAKAAASAKLVRLPIRLRNYILGYFSPVGVSPLPVTKFLALKAINHYYKLTDAKLLALAKHFFESETSSLLKLLDRLQPLKDECMKLGTVYRDREHYGTVARGADRKMPLASIDIPNWENQWEVLDSLRENVYREAFLDTAISLRDLRTMIEEIKFDPTLVSNQIEELWVRIDKIRDEVDLLPLPYNIASRRETRKSLDAMSSIVRRWLDFSIHMRTTKAT